MCRDAGTSEYAAGVWLVWHGFFWKIESALILLKFPEFAIVRIFVSRAVLVVLVRFGT